MNERGVLSHTSLCATDVVVYRGACHVCAFLNFGCTSYGDADDEGDDPIRSECTVLTTFDALDIAIQAK